MTDIINRHKHAIENACLRHGVSRLAFHGSILTERFNDESDIDVLVEFSDDKALHGVHDNLLALDLQKILRRRIDIATFEEIERSKFTDLAEEVLATCKDYYCAQKKTKSLHYR